MNKITKFVTLPVLALGAVVVAIGMTVDAPEREREQAEAAPQEPTAGARFACSEFIRATLNDPRSVEWIDRQRWPTNLRDDGIITVMASYRAANAFGGMVRGTTYCDIVADGGDYRLQNLR